MQRSSSTRFHGNSRTIFGNARKSASAVNHGSISSASTLSPASLTASPVYCATVPQYEHAHPILPPSQGGLLRTEYSFFQSATGSHEEHHTPNTRPPVSLPISSLSPLSLEPFGITGSGEECAAPPRCDCRSALPKASQFYCWTTNTELPLRLTRPQYSTDSVKTLPRPAITVPAEWPRFALWLLPLFALEPVDQKSTSNWPTGSRAHNPSTYDNPRTDFSL